MARLVIAVLFFVISIGCVSASEGQRMRADIDTLDARFAELSNSLATERSRLSDLIAMAEGEITAIQAALEEAEGLLRRSSADFGGQLEAMEGDIQGLRGQLEHADFRLNQLQEQLNLLIEDIDLRLGN